MAEPALNELAHDWCRAKLVGARSSSGNSDKARRSDLARWGRTIDLVKGRDVDDRDVLDLDVDLAGLRPSDLSVDTMLSALEALKGTYRPSTLQRLVSNMRGFVKWLVAAGHLESSPFDSDLVDIKATAEPAVRAFSAADVESMLDAAANPPAGARSAWPARDVAIVDVLASTGVRNGECVALQIGDIGGADRPVLMVRRGTKTGRNREVPLPRRTQDRLNAYLAERQERGLAAGPRHALFVRPTGESLTTANLYYLVKRVAAAAGATLPDDALVHGFRHHYGLQLAQRGLPPATLQQLMGHSDPRTTAIYTRHASFDLINALDDAGWL